MQALSFPGILGAASVGSTLSLTEAGWTEPPTSITYVWTSDGVPIPSATDATYQVAEQDTGHQLSCRVCAINASGNALTVETQSVTAIPAP
jgi:hypothetical protein